MSSIPGSSLPDPGFDVSDKLIHACVYAVLFSLFFYSLNNQNKSVILRRFSKEYALLFTVLYGISDEVHQLFTPGRYFEVGDIIANATGALIVYLFLKLFYKNHSVTKSVSIILLSFILLAGCSSTDKTSGSSHSQAQLIINLDNVESWYDLMPVVGEQTEIFRFTIAVNIEIGERLSAYFSPDQISIRNFSIIFPDRIVFDKNYLLEVSGEGLNRRILIFHDLTEIYSPQRDQLYENVRFSFDVYLENKLIKNIQTGDVQIQKVY